MSSRRYKVIQERFYHLVLYVEQSLATIAAHLFQAQLIDSTSLEEAENDKKIKYERSSVLLRKILKKIEVDQSWYDVFLSVLCKVNLTDTANELNAALEEEDDSFNASPPQLSSPVRHSRYSSKGLACNGEGDSGVIGDEELNSEQLSPVPHSPQGTSAFVYSSPGNFPFPITVRVECSSPNPEVQTATTPCPIREHTCAQHTYNDGPHNEACAQAIAIAELNKCIKKLEEELERGAEEVERKGKEISEKNGKIQRLEMDCMKKDRDFEVLKRDKAKMEKTIEGLEKESRKEIQNVHETYKKRLQKLQEDLEDVQFRERKAQIDLAKAETMLAKAMLDKEREISNLKDKFHNLKDMAAKEKELAAQREIALKEKEIETREELTEEKQKRAQDLVNRAEENTRQAVEAEMRAKKEATLANLRAQKLEAEKIIQDQLVVPDCELYHYKVNKSF